MRSLAQNYFSRGGWVEGAEPPRGPAPPLTGWVLQPKRLVQHSDPETRLYPLLLFTGRKTDGRTGNMIRRVPFDLCFTYVSNRYSQALHVYVFEMSCWVDWCGVISADTSAILTPRCASGWRAISMKWGGKQGAMASRQLTQLMASS